MTELTVWAVCADGTELLLPQPLAITMRRDAAAPADSLELQFAVASPWAPLRRVRVYRNTGLLFQGVVDEQVYHVTAADRRMVLYCRSLTALLLDNEALPQTLENPTAEAAARLLIAPVGLRSALPPGQVRGRLPVEKGDSCYAALRCFCLAAYGGEPYVSVDGWVCLRQKAVGDAVLLPAVREVKLTQKPCRIISEVRLQGETGAYDTVYVNRQAAGVQRRRYVSTAQAAKAPALMQAERADVQAICGDFFWREAGTAVKLPRQLAGRELTGVIEGLLYRQDAAGRQTRVCFSCADG